MLMKFHTRSYTMDIKGYTYFALVQVRALIIPYISLWYRMKWIDYDGY